MRHVHHLRRDALVALPLATLLAACAVRGTRPQPDDGRRWLAGDYHVHSRYSVGWSDSTQPPTPIIAGDARYPIPRNAEMARRHGLAWMVTTDHGGPNHSKVHLDLAYPELRQSRAAVPDLIQFFGMEFDTPAADHSSLIMPHSDHEHLDLAEIERRFAKREAWPLDYGRDMEPRMLEALRHMEALARRPVVIANHPARSAPALGRYGLDTPAEFRAWHDAAPTVAVGMEGAPGHQASALHRDGSIDSAGTRGGYGRHPTMGGFDQMTARLGGLWDAMLGEGRRWWITATSDSHVHWREGGSDFWPGEYAKTYVLARRTHDDILDGIRTGRVFVTTGDLVSQVEVVAEAAGARAATIGGTLVLARRGDVRVTIRVRDPEAPNHAGRQPRVARVDLITGDVTGPGPDRTRDVNPTTRVVRRFTAADWRADGEWLVMEHVLRDVHHTGYLRVRGTAGSELEPAPDPRGEDPWSDLWFYANPIFLVLR
ncbi:MAG: hypothetical protein MUF21_05715 [Gemmatimonadaceae bacterium]|nr:hypothetical protein [Gemmatimonadaceae bacterium]